MQESLLFWFNAAGIPVFFFLVNLFARYRYAGAFTCGGDLLLGLAAFDATVIFSTQQFQSLLRGSVFQARMGEVFFALCASMILIWMIVLVYEPRIQALAAPQNRSFTSFFQMLKTYSLLILSWLGAVVGIAIHIYIFGVQG